MERSKVLRLALAILLSLLGAFCAYIVLDNQSAIDGWQIPMVVAAPLGIVSGFACCFYGLMRFYKDVKNKGWKIGMGLGVIYSGAAGAATGIITGIGIGISQFSEGIGEVAIVAIFGATFGIFQGFFVGAIAGLIFGPIIAKWLL